MSAVCTQCICHTGLVQVSRFVAPFSPALWVVCHLTVSRIAVCSASQCCVTQSGRTQPRKAEQNLIKTQQQQSKQRSPGLVFGAQEGHQIEKLILALCCLGMMSSLARRSSIFSTCLHPPSFFSLQWVSATTCRASSLLHGDSTVSA